MQWSLNAWGLESHSCGGLWDQNHATCHHTLWAHNHTRNPEGPAQRTVGVDQQRHLRLGHRLHHGRLARRRRTGRRTSSATTSSARPATSATRRWRRPGSTATASRISPSTWPTTSTTATATAYSTAPTGAGTSSPAARSRPSANRRGNYIKLSTPRFPAPRSLNDRSAVLAYKKIVSSAGALRLDQFLRRRRCATRWTPG